MRLELVIAVAALLLGSGCVGAPVPADFAAYEGLGPTRAVSADGVIYRVRKEDNEPAASLEFWQEALERRMSDAGYTVVNKKGLSPEGGRAGFWLELAAPVGQQDYSYLVALFVDGDDLVLAEAAGEVTHFAARRDAIAAAVDGLSKKLGPGAGR